ncbi:hypothetical protein R3P38DRAFT_3184773 [Favolaschia claudopus]|uniref:Uncharacterized protein n=1 Tax=Favolaschia claudopus TaxID=2862362 RepID=A0AAW0C8T0_9AGAR
MYRAERLSTRAATLAPLVASHRLGAERNERNETLVNANSRRTPDFTQRVGIEFSAGQTCVTAVLFEVGAETDTYVFTQSKNEVCASSPPSRALLTKSPFPPARPVPTSTHIRRQRADFVIPTHSAASPLSRLPRRRTFKLPPLDANPSPSPLRRHSLIPTVAFRHNRALGSAPKPTRRRRNLVPPPCRPLGSFSTTNTILPSHAATAAAVLLRHRQPRGKPTTLALEHARRNARAAPLADNTTANAPPPFVERLRFVSTPPPLNTLYGSPPTRRRTKRTETLDETSHLSMPTAAEFYRPRTSTDLMPCAALVYLQFSSTDTRLTKTGVRGRGTWRSSAENEARNGGLVRILCQGGGFEVGSAGMKSGTERGSSREVAVGA